MIRLKRQSLILSIAIIIVSFFSCLLFVASPAEAATSTIRGKAWWGDVNKYIYFDCLDDQFGYELTVDNFTSLFGFHNTLDENQNLLSLPNPLGFHFYDPGGWVFGSTPCTDLVHHVSMDASGRLSGQAWNYYRGLITLDATTTPPDNYAFNTHCLGTCNLSTGCLSCYNSNDQKVYGWGRLMGDGTWIRFDNATSSPVKMQGWDYLNHPVLGGREVLPGDFVGYATSSYGDISFNCKSEDNGAGDCSRDYKVYVSNLQVGHMSAPNWSYSQACSDQALKAVLKWYPTSGTQAGYEVVVNTASSSAVSTSSAVCWSGVKLPSVATQYIIPNLDSNCQAPLNYNTDYYWWVRLYYLDRNGDYQATQWYQFGANDGHAGSLDEHTNPWSDSSQYTFRTYKHELPNIFFSWDPADPLVGTSTSFTSTAHYYTTASPSSPQSCSGASCQYLWTTSDLGAAIGSPNGATTSIIFMHATGSSVTLSVTDPDSYTCSTSTTLSINFGLPIWHEVKAE